MIDPIRLEFEVACAQDHAFEIWTAGIDRWWPADHTVTGSDDLLVVLEPRPGGRIFERTPGGVEHDWGEVTVTTRVEIEHRGWEALGAEGETWRDRNHGGWATLLPWYVAAAEA